MINKNDIRLAMRKRIVSATSINPVTQLKREGIEFNPSGLSLWISEYMIGGSETPITKKRSKCNFVVQYDVYTTKNKGVTPGETVCNNIVNEFDINDDTKSNIVVSNLAIIIKNIEVKYQTQGNDWTRHTITFTLEVQTSDSGS